MPGRNPVEAWRGFRDPIVEVIGAVDLATRLTERHFDNGVRMIASPTAGIPFGALTLTFSFHLAHKREGIRNHRMTTLRFTHSLSNDANDRVFAWHWHPESRRSQVRYPHLHVPAGTAFSTKHIPTGRVALEDVVLFGFDELGVQPAYSTGRDKVIEIRDRHKLHRGWH